MYINNVDIRAIERMLCVSNVYTKLDKEYRKEFRINNK
jgi:hypothetical protein